MTAINPLEGEQVLNPGTNKAFVTRRTDPLVTDVSTPADFAAQFPTPLDPTEILALCEDVRKSVV